MDANNVLIWSVALLAIAVLVMGGAMAFRIRKNELTEERVDAALKNRIGATPWRPVEAMDEDEGSFRDNFIVPGHWLSGKLGQALLADEDRKLIDVSGVDPSKGQSWFFLARVVLGVSLPIIAFLLYESKSLVHLVGGIFFGFAFGIMIPKWFLRYAVASRREQVTEELPLFIDLLRLLQGVGLSIDQTLQVLSTEFSGVLKVLGRELSIANAQYANGRSRAQSLRRITLISDSDDVRTIIALLIQVDRHGGAVQEPLKQFGMRLREKRQAQFKEKIGKITVKMTAVMVLTLLPALLVITAGPGFVAVIRAMSSVGG